MKLFPLLTGMVALSAPAFAQPVPLSPDARAKFEAERCVGMAKYPSCAFGLAREAGIILGHGIACGVRKKAPDDFLLPLSVAFFAAHDKAEWAQALDAYTDGLKLGEMEQI